MPAKMITELAERGIPFVVVACIDPRLTSSVGQLDEGFQIRIPGGANGARRISGRREIKHTLKLAYKRGARTVLILGHTDCADCAEAGITEVEQRRQLSWLEHYVKRHFPDMRCITALSDPHGAIVEDRIHHHRPILGSRRLEGLLINVRDNLPLRLRTAFGSR